MIWLPHDTTRAVEAYIETLQPLEALGDREGYQQDDSDAWRRALVPLAIQRTAGPATSLTFSVRDTDRREEMGGRSRTTIRYRSDLTVEFLYLCRPADQDADWRRSDLACHHLLAHLLRHTSDWPAGIDVLDDPAAIGYRRSPTTVTDVLLCEVRVPIAFDAPLIWQE